MRPSIRASILGAAATAALTASAWAQDDDMSVIVIGDGEAADFAGQPVYATAGDGAGAETLSDVPGSWIEVGVIEGPGASEGTIAVAFAPGMMGPDEASRAEVGTARLRLVPDEDDPGAFFVLFDAEDTPLQDELEDLERDRLARIAAAEGDTAEQSEDMTDAPIAEGTDGLDDEGRPIDGGASVEEPEEMRAVPVGPGLVPEVEPLWADEVPEPLPVQAEAEVVVEEGSDEPLREVDIADPDAPPIEDATEVVPAQSGEVPVISSQSEVTSPTHTAAAPEEEAGGVPGIRPDAVPEDFAVADMGTMDPTQLLGVRVYSGDGDEIGEIDRWVGETPGRLPEGAVVNVGGFFGVGDREVAIGTGLLTLMTDADGNGMRVYVEMSEEEIDALPEIEG